MFFIVSKMLAFLLVPFNWIILLFVTFLIVKNKKIKKRLVVAMAVIFVVFSNPFLYKKAVYAWQINEPTITKGRQYEAGIVLGGMTMFDKNDKGYLNERSDRFTETLKLYHLGIIKKIVVSGGSGLLTGKEPPEANFLQQQFIANKVNPADIIVENKSRSTYENAVFSKQKLDSLNLKGPYVLVTSATHLRRSIKVFNKAGMPVVVYPSSFDVIDDKNSWSDFIWPNLKYMADWTAIIKEMVGILAYSVSGKA